MKLELYGCTYTEEENFIWRVWKIHDDPSCLDTLVDLYEKKEKILNSNLADYFRFNFKANQDIPVLIDVYEVDKFDPNELVKLGGKEYKVLHHSYDVENNKQIVVVDKEMARKSLSQEEIEKYHNKYIKEKEEDLRKVNEYIKDREIITKDTEKISFWSRLFK